MLALAQGELWSRESGVPLVGTNMMPTPVFGNPGPNQGPLGEEDRMNFHP